VVVVVMVVATQGAVSPAVAGTLAAAARRGTGEGIMNKADRFFSDEENKAISAAVARAERKTSGEIVVMVVDRSSLYREAAVFGGFVLAGVVAMAIELALNGFLSLGRDWSAAQGAATHWFSAAQAAELWTFLPILFLAYLPCRLLCTRVEPLRLFFVPHRRREQAVVQNALRMFHLKGLDRTRDATGVLIYFSLAERRVRILGDRGIDTALTAEGWRRFADRLSVAERAGRAAVEVQAVVDELGELLGQRFPRRADDTNELSDEVQVVQGDGKQ
jgi:putative membrane protein